ncbi:DUF6069 family protein [Streptomyces sp. NPDC019443]|uniref:DUF6069 family protein n=1 Tax=Streptomyces sp. NPDC019443 TaxID=3365061 RepID=UPI003788D91F
MTSTTANTARPATRHRYRALTVLIAAAAALLVWVVAVPIVGHELLVPQSGDQKASEITAPYVLVMSLAASLAGWLLLVILERHTARPHAIWTVIASVTLLVSFTPLLTLELATATRIWLALMHLAVAAILIPALPRSAAGPPPSA